MSRRSLCEELFCGLAAGIAGTAVMMLARRFDEQYAPATIARSTDDPGHFLLAAAEKSTDVHLSKPLEEAAALSLHAGYGTSAGVIYGLLNPAEPLPLTHGVLLGGAVWAAEHLGCLPGVGLTQPAWKQKMPEVMGELLRHVMFGVSVVGAFAALRKIVR